MAALEFRNRYLLYRSAPEQPVESGVVHDAITTHVDAVMQVPLARADQMSPKRIGKMLSHRVLHSPLPVNPGDACKLMKTRYRRYLELQNFRIHIESKAEPL